MSALLVAMADEHVDIIIGIRRCILLVVPRSVPPRRGHRRIFKFPSVVNFADLALVRFMEVSDHADFVTYVCRLLIQHAVWIAW